MSQVWWETPGIFPTISIILSIILICTYIVTHHAEMLELILSRMAVALVLWLLALGINSVRANNGGIMIITMITVNKLI